MARTRKQIKPSSAQAARAKSGKRLRRSANKASQPVRVAGRLIAKVFRPLAFLLVPFRTRPARFVGRILATVLLINYVRSSWKELRQVTWTSRRETLRLTGAVFLFSIGLSILISVTDYGLDKVFKNLILR